MDIMFSQTQILQLIGLSLGKIMALPVTLRWFKQEEWIGDTQELANTFPIQIDKNLWQK